MDTMKIGILLIGVGVGGLLAIEILRYRNDYKRRKILIETDPLDPDFDE